MSKSFDRLVDIMSLLRGEGGCPWDREQTHETLRPYLIEEAYETLEAIDSENKENFKEELGDLLLQIVFHAQIAGEEGRFRIDDVIDGICEKLVRRHPHVFGDTVADTPEIVLENWEKIKKTEKPDNPRKSALEGVPLHMPSLLRAWRLQSKAKSAGFDFSGAESAYDKVEEEIKELRRSVARRSRENFEEELGDLLFSLVNVSRFMKVNPEEALRKSIKKFIGRFRYIEDRMEGQNRKLNEASIEEMDTLWEEAKGRNV